MGLTIRPAKVSDLNEVVQLLVADGAARHAHAPDLWHLDAAPHEKTRLAIKNAMAATAPAFRQHWLVADTGDELVGVTHSILLPVPPIYAGELGPPGLIMEDCWITPHAPPGTRRLLLDAAETDLVEAGALIVLASSVDAGAWEAEYNSKGYEPLTKYFAKTGLSRTCTGSSIHPATTDNVPSITALSAVHRRIIDGLNHRFWKPHVHADTRFGNWMHRSLTLADRDMFVAGKCGQLRGYAISQPATSLHFPVPHDISGVGVIDDYFHDALVSPEKIGGNMEEASALLAAAEAARGHRGDHSVLVVCPAAWSSKIALLEHSGYSNAITWHVKFVA